MTFDLIAFRAWLTKRGARVQKYQPRTIAGLVSTAGHVLALYEQKVAPADWPTHPVARQTIERMHAFLGASERAPDTSSTDAALRDLSARLAAYLTAWVPPSKARKNAAHSVDDAGWARLLEAFRKDESLEARVLDLMAASGMRISDALGIWREALLTGVKTGSVAVQVKGGKVRHKPTAGAPIAWGALAAAFGEQPLAKNIAMLICPDNASPAAGACAYTRVRRALIRIGKSVGVDGRIHLHRLRRTLVVQALRDGHDIALVQQAFDHESIATTATYSDEAQEHRVAQMQQSIAKRFGGEKP